MSPLGYLSLMLQFFGLVITAAGLRLTWQTFGDPNETFVGEFIRVAKRVIPFHRGTAVQVRGAADGAGSAENASVQILYGPLPDDEKQAIKLVGQRLQDLRSDYESTMANTRREVDQTKRRLDELEGNVTSEVDRLEQADRRIATDGIRLESVGLVFVALGVVAQLIDGLLR